MPLKIILFIYIVLLQLFNNALADIISYDQQFNRIVFNVNLLQSKDLYCEEWIASDKQLNINDQISKYSEHELGYYNIVNSSYHMVNHPGGVKDKTRFCDKVNLYRNRASREGTEIIATFVFRKKNNSEIYAVLALGDDGKGASDHLSYLGVARKKGQSHELLRQLVEIIGTLIINIEKFNRVVQVTKVSGVVQYGFAIQASKAWESVAIGYGFELSQYKKDHKLYKKYFEMYKNTKVI